MTRHNTAVGQNPAPVATRTRARCAWTAGHSKAPAADLAPVPRLRPASRRAPGECASSRTTGTHKKPRRAQLTPPAPVYRAAAPQTVQRQTPLSGRDRSWVCTEEGSAWQFSQRDLLQRHKRTHSTEHNGPGPAQDCNRTFATRGSNRSPRLCHNSAKPWPCPEQGCGLRFGYQGNLARHKRVHSAKQVDPCSCRSCGKPFGNQQALQRHQASAASGYDSRIPDRWPAGAWPLVWPNEQENTTANQTARRDHTDKDTPCRVRVWPGRILHQDSNSPRAYTCPVRYCGKGFMTRQKLQQHIARHRAARDYPCPEGGCFFSCVSRAWLAAHISAHRRPPKDRVRPTDDRPDSAPACPTEEPALSRKTPCLAEPGAVAVTGMPVRTQAAGPDAALLPLADDVLDWLAQQPTSGVASHPQSGCVFSPEQPFEHWMDPPDQQQPLLLQASLPPPGSAPEPRLWW